MVQRFYVTRGSLRRNANSGPPMEPESSVRTDGESGYLGEGTGKPAMGTPTEIACGDSYG